MISLLPLSPFLLLSLYILFTCLHLFSIQNDLTPLEVVTAKQAEGAWYDIDWDYGRVVDLLREICEEPATLPSHDVSRLTATDTHAIGSLH